MSSAEENNQVFLEPLSSGKGRLDEETSDSSDDSDLSQSSSELAQLEPGFKGSYNSSSIDMNNYYAASNPVDSWQYSNPYGQPVAANSSYHHPCYSYYTSPSFSYSTNHDHYNQQYASCNSSSFNSSSSSHLNSSVDSKSTTPPPLFNLPISAEHQQPLSVQTYSPPPTSCGLQAPHQSTPSLITTISAVNSAAATYNSNSCSYVNPNPGYDSSYNSFPAQNYSCSSRNYFGKSL